MYSRLHAGLQKLVFALRTMVFLLSWMVYLFARVARVPSPFPHFAYYYTSLLLLAISVRNVSWAHGNADVNMGYAATHRVRMGLQQLQLPDFPITSHSYKSTTVASHKTRHRARTLRREGSGGDGDGCLIWALG